MENPSAFPHKNRYYTGSTDRYEDHQVKGMTLRDYFAGQALQAYFGDKRSTSPLAEECYTDVARTAYSYADAMLKERLNKGEADEQNND